MQEIRELADKMRDKAIEYSCMAAGFRMVQGEILRAEEQARNMTKTLLAIGPSDAERAEWPDTTRAYVESLEAIYDHAMFAVGQLNARREGSAVARTLNGTRRVPYSQIVQQRA
jgi:hypothetical protein